MIANKTSMTADIYLKKANLIAAYEERHLKSKKILEDASEVLPGGNTRVSLFNAPFSLVMAHGENCYLTTVDGQKYLDFLSEFTAGIYGHSHSVIHEAIKKVMDVGINLGAHTQYEAELARLITARFKSIEMIRFSNSATEANMTALGAARYYSKRSKVSLASFE